MFGELLSSGFPKLILKMDVLRVLMKRKDQWKAIYDKARPECNEHIFLMQPQKLTASNFCIVACCIETKFFRSALL